jgi:glycosyltransferase involved in cell wall biosynthesis
MNNLKKLAIVPALNEADSIADVVGELHRYAPDFDVLVVDDGSIDGTGDRAEEAGAEVIRHVFRLGIGGAVQTGFKHARRFDYDVAVQVDGDGQHDPSYLPAMLERLHTEGEADMVCGTRFLGEAGYDVPLARRAGMRVFRLLLSTIVGQRVTDPTSGFRMTNRRGIELFARDYPHDYPEVEAILMLHAHKLQLHEVPVQMRQRASGRSSIGRVSSAYYMFRVLLAIFVGLFRRTPVPAPGERLLPGLPAEG